MESFESLTEKINAVIKKINQDKKINHYEITKDEAAIIKSVKSISEVEQAKIILAKLENISLRYQKNAAPVIEPYANTRYTGNIRFNDLPKSHLIKVNATEYKNEFFVLFKPDLIQNYSKINHDEKQAFEDILDAPKFCGPIGQAGIKQIIGNPPSCKVDINGTILNTHFSHELKIKGRALEGRIALYALEPLQNNGPTILVASHYLAQGMHATKDLKKKYNANLVLTENCRSKQSSHLSHFFKNEKKVAPLSDTTPDLDADIPSAKMRLIS